MSEELRVFDSHCHLEMVDPASVGAVLERAWSLGVRDLLAVGTGRGDFARLAAIVARYPGIRLALGVHPWVAEDDGRDLGPLLERWNAVAVGEIGLDFSRQRPTRVAQMARCRVQLLLARELGLPVVLHCVKAFGELLALLDETGPHHGALHAFSKGPELAREFLRRGLSIGLGGRVLEASDRLVRTVVSLPRDRIILESDAPHGQFPGVHRGQSQPADVLSVARKVARLRGCSEAEVAEETRDNARRLFG